ncbi:MAG TPA: hypothetical protein VKQ08_04870 [Cyclobacteriaceae bacterium]|nr:hypothetical protein [Cyclobacteriaceae bacterium]
MSRMLAISFLLLYINSNTEVHEMLRLPILLEHFSQHKKLVSDISFWDFLVMHYESDVNHDSDDNQLPFKDPGHSFTAPTLALPIHKMVLKETVVLAEVDHSFFYHETFIASHLSDIFQPPRIS